MTNAAHCTCCIKHRRRDLRERQAVTYERAVFATRLAILRWKMLGIAICMLVVMAAFLIRMVVQ